ncbi:hypothetical protein [Streptomyces cylindrosporus]|uniref:Uncharacterized protein n=1 Tax=Streptomyces cylindrosporus TaxID=2927583 RepID=A0ABS9YKC1_9ACTN|nr:hypothetical protein [Streptomyces cylindrosporus]MCI3277668.1 hypothetical protein [Streptomyces cylindrosporus]
MIAPDHRILQWLARVHGSAREANTEWRTQGVAMLPMGDRLCAIKLRGELVHAACNTDDPAQVATILAERLDGAVIGDDRVGATYYPLINNHAGLVWDLDNDAPCLGDGVYLGVPDLHRVAPPGAHWVVRPRYEGDLCRPQFVRDLVAAGTQRLRPAGCS